MFDYFYGQQAEQFSFYRIPKILFTDKKFEKLSIEAKLLYGILLDRMNCSARNGWFDKKNRVYIIFTVDEIMEHLGCAKQKATKLLNELETTSGLIERKRQGLGKPNLIYVKNFIVEDEKESNFKKYENQTSGSMKNKTQEVLESNGNNINYKDINNSDINSSIIPSESKEIILDDDLEILMDERERYKTHIKEKLEYEFLLQKYPYNKKMVNEILELIVDTLCSRQNLIRIGGEDKPLPVVKSRFLDLDFTHIEYVITCLLENTSKVRNMKQYLLTTLYNAPLTIDNYYTSMVQHDMYGDDY